jgi:hypothetical protein
MNPVDALYYWVERLNYSSPTEEQFPVEIVAVFLLVIALISFLLLR